MPTPPTGAAGRARLAVETLEDRTVPATESFDPTRVLVTVTAPTAPAATLATLPSATPVAPGLYRVNLAAELSVTAAVDALGRVPGLTAQPDYRVAPAAVPNDPSFGSQWALRNTGQSGGRAGADVGGVRAWDAGRGTGQTIVAVVDSGVDYRHPDLAANMWRNPREVPGNGRDDDGNGFADDVFGADFANNDGDPFDDVGHGTGVAGVIGAVGNNGVGVAGVAWTTRIMALKFMGSAAGGYTSDAVRAIDYAVANGARVINLSWGNGHHDPAVAAAVARARASGAIVVAAAGNQGSDNDRAPFFPANLTQQSDNVLSVAATDHRDDLASFSNFGRTTVTVAAPGVSLLTTQPNNRYAILSGTSVAAPMVAGAVALTWDLNPTWTYRQVMGKLGWSVDTLPQLAGKVATNGRVNVARMAHPPVTPPPPASPPPPVGGDTTGPRVVAATFGGPAAGAFDRVRVTFSEPVNPGTLTSATAGAVGPIGSIGVSAAVPVAGTNNTVFTLVLSQRQTAAGVYTVAVGPGVRDMAGNALDQNGNGVNGEATDVFVASAPLGGPVTPPPAPPPPAVPPPPANPSAGRVTYSAGGLPKPILDRRTTRIDFAVTDTFRVADLNVELDVSHARTWDLSVRIVAPDGRSVTLFNRRGGNGANLSNTVFDDAAANSIVTAAAPFGGAFKPEQLLSLFNGMSATGVWSVQVFDLADGMTGTVNRVTLSFAPQAAGQTINGASLAELAKPSAWAPLTAAQLRGASDAVRSAVLGGRGDVAATS